MASLLRAASAILGSVLLVALGVWLIGGRSGLFSGSTRQAAPQVAATSAPATQATIPPLDTAAPTKIETATFALG